MEENDFLKGWKSLGTRTSVVDLGGGDEVMRDWGLDAHTGNFPVTMTAGCWERGCEEMTNCENELVEANVCYFLACAK